MGLRFLLYDAFEGLFTESPFRIVGRHKDQPRSVVSRIRQFNAFFGAGFRKESVRDLYQYPGPVSRLRIAAHGTAVTQPLKDFNALLDRSVTLLPLNVTDEPHPATVMFESRIVKSLFFRKAHLSHLLHLAYFIS